MTYWVSNFYCNTDAGMYNSTYIHEYIHRSIYTLVICDIKKRGLGFSDSVIRAGIYTPGAGWGLHTNDTTRDAGSIQWNFTNGMR
jgi:hypothetical protein